VHLYDTCHATPELSCAGRGALRTPPGVRRGAAAHLHAVAERELRRAEALVAAPRDDGARRRRVRRLQHRARERRLLQGRDAPGGLSFADARRDRPQLLRAHMLGPVQGTI